MFHVVWSILLLCTQVWNLDLTGVFLDVISDELCILACVVIDDSLLRYSMVFQLRKRQVSSFSVAGL